ncbi:YceI family protein [Streptomyces sp. HPF1205]|uniref:YceI family protein n=1 Tax=Streptomyces sp. HPF1205 TaxID=2873262 RepID=UPI0021F19DB6|nr:YceI family protein [Streptomyces sp. HPF1205]
MIFKTVHGRFPIVSAEVSVDAEGAPRSVTATLDADGFSTGHPKRDTHVRSKDFLHAQAHPHLTFRSTAVVPREPGTWLVEGHMTLRGVTSGVHLTSGWSGTGTTPPKPSRPPCSTGGPRDSVTARRSWSAGRWPCDST